MLEERLKEQYLVISLSFEAADDLFVSLYTLAAGFIRKAGRELKVQGVEEEILKRWNEPVSGQFPFDDLSEKITELCGSLDRGIILMIDEVDK